MHPGVIQGTVGEEVRVALGFFIVEGEVISSVGDVRGFKKGDCGVVRAFVAKDAYIEG